METFPCFTDRPKGFHAVPVPLPRSDDLPAFPRTRRGLPVTDTGQCLLSVTACGSCPAPPPRRSRPRTRRAEGYTEGNTAAPPPRAPEPPRDPRGRSLRAAPLGLRRRPASLGSSTCGSAPAAPRSRRGHRKHGGVSGHAGPRSSRSGCAQALRSAGLRFPRSTWAVYPACRARASPTVWTSVSPVPGRKDSHLWVLADHN